MITLLSDTTNPTLDVRSLRDTLNTSSQLARDECGDWHILGRRGKLFADSQWEPYWYLYIDRSWTRAKRALSFMEIHQDGDADGVLRLKRLPTEQEARLIRKWAGLSAKRKLTPERRAKLIEAGMNFRFSHGAQPTNFGLICTEISSP